MIYGRRGEDVVQLERDAMAGSKKHPLEIYKQLDKGARQPKSATPRSKTVETAPALRDAPPSSGSSGASREMPQVQRPLPRRSESTVKASSPGDFSLTLTLNQMVILLFFVILVIFGGYLFGFYRGERKAARSVPLEIASTLSHDERTGSSTSGDREDRGGADSASVAESATRGVRFGVLIASYNANTREIRDLTRRILIERGFRPQTIFTAFYESEEKYALIVGSFDRQDDPDLGELQMELRGIDDFPGSDPAPFRSAYIVKHPQTTRRGS